MHTDNTYGTRVHTHAHTHTCLHTHVYTHMHIHTKDDTHWALIALFSVHEYGE